MTFILGMGIGVGIVGLLLIIGAVISERLDTLRADEDKRRASL